MMKKSLILLTVATEEKPMLSRLRVSASQNDYNLKVLGFGEKWGGWMWRCSLYLEALQNEDKNTIIGCIDAYDVLIVQNSEIALKKYRQITENQIVSAVENYWGSNAGRLDEYWKKTNFSHCLNLNAGVIFGPVYKLIDAFEWILKNGGTHDDQIAWGRYVCLYPHEYMPDVENSLVCMVWDVETAKQCKNNATCFLHLSGLKDRTADFVDKVLNEMNVHPIKI